MTECVTGLDLVREQLRIAAGEPLGYGQDDVELRGHAIEVRLYAEDVPAGFLPATGTLHAFEPAATPAVRWDAGVRSGSVIGTSFDPMLAKVIAHAPSRAEAAGRLRVALERTHLGGDDQPRPPRRDVATPRVSRRGHHDGLLVRHEPAVSRRRTSATAPHGRRRRVVDPGREPGERTGAGVHALRLPDRPSSRPAAVLRCGDREVTIDYRSMRDGSFLVDGTERAVVHSWDEQAIDVVVGRRRDPGALHAPR